MPYHIANSICSSNMQKNAYTEMYAQELTHGWYRGTREVLLAHLKKLKPQAKILDAGCGTGGTMLFLKQNHFTNVFGVDQSPLALAYSKKRGLKSLRRGSITRLPFPKASFDAVICLDVLYHAGVNPSRAISEFYRVLKPTGLIYLQEPAYNWLRSSHDIYIQTQHRFYRQELINLLRRQNFAVSKCTYLNTLLFPLQVIKRVKDKFFPSSHSDVQPLHPLVNQLLLQALRLEARLIKFINLPFGLSLVCVEKKTGL